MKLWSLPLVTLMACGGASAEFQDYDTYVHPGLVPTATVAEAEPVRYVPDAPVCIEPAQAPQAHISEAHGCPDYRLPWMVLTGELSAIEGVWGAAQAWNEALGFEQFSRTATIARVAVLVQWADPEVQQHYESHGILGGAGLQVDHECRIETATIILRGNLLDPVVWHETQMHELGHVLNLRHHRDPGTLMWGRRNGCAEPDQATIEFLRARAP